MTATFGYSYPFTRCNQPAIFHIHPQTTCWSNSPQHLTHGPIFFGTTYNPQCLCMPCSNLSINDTPSLFVVMQVWMLPNIAVALGLYTLLRIIGMVKDLSPETLDTPKLLAYWQPYYFWSTILTTSQGHIPLTHPYYCILQQWDHHHQNHLHHLRINSTPQLHQRAANGKLRTFLSQVTC